MADDANSLDLILKELGGFGWYQRRICFLIVICVIFSYFPLYIYVFECKQVNHRCQIQGCDAEDTKFVPEWLINAVPFNNDGPLKCSKYHKINSTSNHCSFEDFNQEILERCDTYIYETPDISIIHDFNLQCDENVWKLTLVGTLNTVGLMIGQPISGLMSDRFGRKIILISSMILSGIIGLVRSFAHSYSFFLTMEIIDTTIRSAAFNLCLILCLELVSSEKRSLLALLMNFAITTGGIFEGGLAWILQSWRPLLRILYSLPLLTIFYYWLIPESIRWLLAAGRLSEANTILKKLAETNGKTISDDYIRELKLKDIGEKDIKILSIREFISSVALMRRLIIISICWMCSIFVYSGLTINAVSLSSNSYLDFILSMLVEMPASIATFLVMDRIGRKITLSTGFILSGIFSISSLFIPTKMSWLRLTVYLLGKFSISIDEAILCTYTSEMFPTQFRSLSVSICFMFGRLAGLIAPQLPLLESIWKPLPMTLFGSSALVTGLLSLLLPETKGTKLPNTIKEAESIGKRKEDTSSNIKKL